jgi:superoxide dismutase, Cu-Zn family
VRRFIRAAAGGLAGCALLLGGMQAASGETLLQQVFPAWLTDLDTDDVAPPPDGLPMTGAFDSAKAKLKVTERSDGNTTFTLEVRAIDPDFDGRTFGAHLHTGSCEADVPTAAGPHYKHADPDLIFPNNEVWLDVTPNEGEAVTQTVVPFVPKDPNGLMSVVIHRDFTKPDGSAGPREACLPLDVTGTWGPPVIETP